jgi:hypothetical protein
VAESARRLLIAGVASLLAATGKKEQTTYKKFIDPKSKRGIFGFLSL